MHFSSSLRRQADCWDIADPPRHFQPGDRIPEFDKEVVRIAESLTFVSVCKPIVRTPPIRSGKLRSAEGLLIYTRISAPSASHAGVHTCSIGIAIGWPNRLSRQQRSMARRGWAEFWLAARHPIQLVEVRYHLPDLRRRTDRRPSVACAGAFTQERSI